MLNKTCAGVNTSPMAQQTKTQIKYCFFFVRADIVVNNLTQIDQSI